MTNNPPIPDDPESEAERVEERWTVTGYCGDRKRLVIYNGESYSGLLGAQLMRVSDHEAALTQLRLVLTSRDLWKRAAARNLDEARAAERQLHEARTQVERATKAIQAEHRYKAAQGGSPCVCESCKSP